MAKRKEFPVHPDKRGVWWDLLLYVPTVIALMLIGLKLWYSGKEGWGYLLEFLATFFAFVGANRPCPPCESLPSRAWRGRYFEQGWRVR